MFFVEVGKEIYCFEDVGSTYSCYHNGKLGWISKEWLTHSKEEMLNILNEWNEKRLNSAIDDLAYASKKIEQLTQQKERLKQKIF